MSCNLHSSSNTQVCPVLHQDPPEEGCRQFHHSVGLSHNQNIIQLIAIYDDQNHTAKHRLQDSRVLPSLDRQTLSDGVMQIVGDRSGRCAFPGSNTHTLSL